MSAAGPVSPVHTLASQQAAHAAIIDTVQRARGPMWWFARDFAYWPLADAALLDALRAWGLRRPPQARAELRILALDWGAVAARYPVFTRLRRDLSHVIACRRVAPRLAQELFDGVGSDTQAVWGPTPTWGSASLTTSAVDLTRLRAEFDTVWRDATEHFAPDVLGL